MALTDSRLRHLKPKVKSYKASEFYDLFVSVLPSGSILFRFKYRVDDKEGLLSFGKYPDVSLLQARQKRDEARTLVAAGINQITARQVDIAQTHARRSLIKPDWVD